MNNLRITKDLLTHLNTKSGSDLASFAQDFVAHSDERDISKISNDRLAPIIRLHWDHVKKVKSDKPVVLTSSLKDDKGNPIGTQLDILSRDMAFIVDSVTAELSEREFTIDYLVHPISDPSVYGVKADFKISHIHVRLANALPEAELKKLSARMNAIIGDVMLSNDDWPMMKVMLRECQKALSYAPLKKYNDVEIEEHLEFLEYLYQDNFTLLGYREYTFSDKEKELSAKPVKSSSLGLLRNERKPIFLNNKEMSLPQHMKKKRTELPTVFVSKVNRASTVHRRVPLDCISVKLFNKDGSLRGEGVFIGLFTSVTYNRSLRSLPYLRHKAESVVALSGFEAGTHDYRSLRHILEKYPRDELFQIDVKQLYEFSLSIMRLYERRNVALYVREDLFGRYVSALIYVPRDRFETRLRLRFKDILEETFNGTVTNYHLSIDDSALARVLYTVDVDPFKPVKYNHSKTQTALQDAAESWSQKLFDTALEFTKSEADAYRIRETYAEAFTADYQVNYSLCETLRDIEKIEEITNTQEGITFDLLAGRDDEKHNTLHLKAYNRGQPLPLSKILPVLENMGLDVESELPSKVTLGEGPNFWVHDFAIQTELAEGEKIDFNKVKPLFEEALFKILSGEVEDDRFNRLILKAGLSSEQIVVLRGYLRYLRQTHFGFSKTFCENVIARFPEIARLLVDLFEARFNPSLDDVREKDVTKVRNALSAELEKVTSIDHDQIIRSFINVISNTLRTNFYQRDENGMRKSWVSFKFDSSKITTLPKPRPYREIFVYSRRTEGIHLRGDQIARGGIRWSDRHEDFRTEVLGLMKAQQTKNAIIVPMGAKGGFIVKQPPVGGDRQAQYNEGVECYKTFIRGLLDITDNLKGNKVIPPKDVVRHDGDDPYLVVAADKGTASFSDIANGLSAEYDFWLKDAFASGGSAGYDHKKMGITARGAWESVKRHFRELNFDTQSQDFTVVGVGDMGGDVFGNGMLLSEHIKLVAAFNHLHIVLDPNPDAAKSFKERERLFKEGKGWNHYKTDILSKGGRIYERTDKSLELTPEIQKLLGTEEKKLSPTALMSMILKMEADLIWFGGIGTYIKATSESHADAGDKSNDSIRVDATEVRAKVIGEGANLAITQRARIEYAQNGGRINADFIDNSAGVDSSDHEVNIKILLNKMVDAKNSGMSLKSRNVLLEDMTEEVASLVLNHNYQQAQALSLMELCAPAHLDNHTFFMQDLERRGLLDRKVEFLPSDEEIEQRREKHKGLTRPELAVLSCYAKITLQKAILKTSLPSEKLADRWLIGYFPHPLQKKYEKQIKEHRLKREIFATVLASTVINRLGPSFVEKLISETGFSLEEIMNAFVVVHDVFDLSKIWADIEALDGKMPAMAQLKALRDMEETVERLMMWFLNSYPRRISPERDIALFSKDIQSIKSHMKNALPDGRRQQISQQIEALKGDGFSEEVAEEIALLSPLSAAGDIVLMTQKLKLPIATVSKVYYKMGEHFSLYWMRKQARYLTPETDWEKQSISLLREKLYKIQAELARAYLSDHKEKASSISDKALETWLEEQESRESRQVINLVESMRAAGSMSLAMLNVAIETLRGLYEKN